MPTLTIAIKRMKLLEVYLSPLDERRFQAIATHSPTGDGDAESCLPFWEGEQDRRSTLIKVLEGSGSFRPEHFPRPGEQEWMKKVGILNADQPSFHPHYLEQIGKALYTSLFPPTASLKSVLDTSLRLAEQAGTELHLRLKFSADSAARSRLADYPWELLHDGQRFLQPRQVVISRYIAYEALPPAFLPQAQLRVLLISPRAEDAAQGLAKLSDVEQQAIGLGLSQAASEGVILMESLPRATFKALSTYLSKRTEAQMPQVLHFDGHGLFGKRCTNPQCSQIHAGIKVEHCQNCKQPLPEPTGFLLFEDEQGAPDYVSANRLAADLPKGVTLVVLSACQSGMAVAGESVFNGMAQQLIDARVPAVVAMQYAVQVKAASDFAEPFYRALGQRKTLLEALNAGQRGMGVEGNQWYRPVLYLRWKDNDGGQLFKSLEGESLTQSAEVRQPRSEATQASNTRSASSKARRDSYTRQLDEVNQKLAVVEADLGSATDLMRRLALKNTAEVLLKEIDDLDAKLAELDSKNPDQKEPKSS